MTTIPPTFPVKDPGQGKLGVITATVTFATGAVQVGAIPLLARILRATCILITAFNAGTTNVLTAGVTLANANELIGSADVTEATPATYLAPGANLAAVNSATATGNDEGGVGLFVKYAQTGTAATTGLAVFVFEFVNSND